MLHTTIRHNSNYNVLHLPVLQIIVIVPLHLAISTSNHVNLNAIDCTLKPILQPLFILDLIWISSTLPPDLIFFECVFNNIIWDEETVISL